MPEIPFSISIYLVCRKQNDVIIKAIVRSEIKNNANGLYGDHSLLLSRANPTQKELDDLVE